MILTETQSRSDETPLVCIFSVRSCLVPAQATRSTTQARLSPLEGLRRVQVSLQTCFSSNYPSFVLFIFQLGAEITDAFTFVGYSQ